MRPLVRMRTSVGCSLLALGLAACLPAGCGQTGAGAAADAGPTATRRYTFRAIGGFSMGSLSAAFIGLRHHQRFDLLAPMGGPLDGAAMLHVLETQVFGGFCTPPQPGRMCPAAEAGQDYEHLDMGHGLGQTTRTSLLEAFLGAAVVWGNFMLYNPEHPYLPPGVPEAYLEDPALYCDQPLRLEGFYDRRFNPDGTAPVITFCDGRGSEPGVFDPDGPHRFAVEIALAVDLNHDGRRGAGEPVLFQRCEPFDDVGRDGLASADEAGYDPQHDADPAGDDFHPLDNPLGSEGNHRYEAGEPYRDHGLDGVAGTASSPWDLGEGNGRFDRNPAVARQFERTDPLSLLAALDDDALARLDFYLDVGLRDHFRFRPQVETFAGRLGARGRPVDVRRGFAALLEPGTSGSFDIHHIDWETLGRDLLLIYGDPRADTAAIEAGDGGHVGSAAQLLWRFFTMLAWISHSWPDGDFEPLDPPGEAQVLQASYDSAILDRERPYWIYLPPGYEQRPDRRYPVLYLLHGMGMEPELMTSSVLFAEPWMNEGVLQKFIIVFPDGRCGEDCLAGTFFANQSGRQLPPLRYEDAFVQELMAHIDASYRTRPAVEMVRRGDGWAPPADPAAP